jgi:hypothetical protein
MGVYGGIPRGGIPRGTCKIKYFGDYVVKFEILFVAKIYNRPLNIMLKKSQPIPVPSSRHKSFPTDNDIIIVLPEIPAIHWVEASDLITPTITPPTDLEIGRSHAPAPSNRNSPHHMVTSPFNYHAVCHCAWIPQPKDAYGLHCGSFYTKNAAQRHQTKLLSDLMSSQMDRMDRMDRDMNEQFCHFKPNTYDVIVSL